MRSREVCARYNDFTDEARRHRSTLETAATRRFRQSRRVAAFPEAHARRAPQLEAKYATIGDYVLCRVFGWEAQPAGDGKLRAVPPVGFARTVRFVANDYPYTLAPGVEHHIVWVASPAGDVSALSPEALVEEVLRHRPAEAWEALTAVNPPRLQSVTNVWHAHVFSRPRPRPEPAPAEEA